MKKSTLEGALIESVESLNSGRRQGEGDVGKALPLFRRRVDGDVDLGRRKLAAEEEEGRFGRTCSMSPKGSKRERSSSSLMEKARLRTKSLAESRMSWCALDGASTTGAASRVVDTYGAN